MAQKTDLIPLARQVAVSLLYFAGTMLAAYHIIAFKSDKFGVYYQDDNQLWFAVGAGLLVIGWAVRNWKKI